jgi:hypothetical protein
MGRVTSREGTPIAYERQTLEGQSHVTDQKTVAPVLERFFGAAC